MPSWRRELASEDCQLNSRAERTLDPEDWDELRALGHRMVDDMFAHLRTLREQPAWQPLPPEVAGAFHQPVPYRPTPAGQVYEQFLKQILPYTTGNRHPRAWGWVRGTGTPLAMLADMLASGMNAHAGGGQQSSTLVEEQALRWLTELMGMPPESTGLLTSGGTMSNLLGLAVARNTRAGIPIRRDGLAVSGAENLRIYCSTETHSWIRKAVELLGLGERSLRRIPVDDNYRIRVDELALSLTADMAAGLHPIAVVASCGTVNTGAIDDLVPIADLCQKHGVWLHIDGAFGALLKLSKLHAGLVAGLERADSLGFDLHKWMYLPFEIGCLLVRDPKAHAEAFAARADYLEPTARGIMAGGLVFSDRGIELTRGFKALKLWMSLKTHGVEAYSALIDQNVAQARYLEELVTAEPELELAAPRITNVVCYRYRPAKDLGVDPDSVNRELVLRLQESGRFVVSGAILHGQYAVRVANTNHRSRREDFAALASDSTRIGREIAAQMAANLHQARA